MFLQLESYILDKLRELVNTESICLLPDCSLYSGKHRCSAAKSDAARSAWLNKTIKKYPVFVLRETYSAQCLVFSCMV
jgi:hypothetical protein